MSYQKVKGNESWVRDPDTGVLLNINEYDRIRFTENSNLRKQIDNIKKDVEEIKSLIREIGIINQQGK